MEDYVGQESIKKHILAIQPQNSTNMSAGMEEATKQFKEYVGANSDEYENRIIFLTDAMPNTGDTSESGMLGTTKTNADSKIYTTFIGIGVDFNTELIELITKVRGANYYSVHTPSEFKKRMDEGFDYMVTPLVFNLKLHLDAPGFEIVGVYGSPEADEATGDIMKVNTLFPSQRVEGETRGGLILLQMKKLSDDNTIRLVASYEDRTGKQDSSSSTFNFEQKLEYYDNTGIRKGIVLARYANLLKNWLVYERMLLAQQDPDLGKRLVVPSVESYRTDGIPVIGSVYDLGRWERQSTSLRVAAPFKQFFSEFLTYLDKEITAIGDQSMSKESDVLRLLVN